MKISHRTNWINICVLTAILACSTGLLRAATSVSQHGITWTFSADKTVGQYANGDYYVVGPVTITSISPASTLISGRTMNGSMINPRAGSFTVNGFDSALLNYNAASNVGRPKGADLSASNPLVVAVGSTVVSVRSIAAAGNRPQFSDGAYLTVVAAAPAAGSFRPSPSNPDKTPPGNVSELDYTILRNLPSVSGTPSLAEMEAAFARPWFEIELSNAGREWHPDNNQPIYGRDMGTLLGDGLLLLHINHTPAEKQKLFVSLVQYGLDVYGAAKYYGDTDEYPGWWANGGFNCGRKAPMLLAGMALKKTNILAEANAVTYPIFQEDQGTFYVGTADVGRTVNDNYVTGTVKDRMRHTFTAGMVGLPDWRVEYGDTNKGSNLNTIYRDVNSPVILSHALAILLTPNGKASWNNPAYFDYADRIAHIDITAAAPFALNMFSAYRSYGPAVWTPPAPVFGPGYIPVEGTILVLSASDAVKIGAGGNPTVTVSASGGAVTATYSPTITTPSLTANGYGKLSSNLKFSLSRKIGSGETCTFSITNGTNKVEAVKGGLDAVSASGVMIYNYSTASGGSGTTPIPPSNAKTVIAISP